MVIAGDPNATQCYVGSPKLQTILNEYSHVVQEYFQKRVKTWLSAVGKPIFDIEHYWARYEFAPGRGQIHTHMLCILKNNAIHELCYHHLKNKIHGEKKRAECLARWANSKFGLTAEMPLQEKSFVAKCHPSSQRYSDTDSYLDAAHLMQACQMHECSGFCMKASTSKHE